MILKQTLLLLGFITANMTVSAIAAQSNDVTPPSKPLNSAISVNQGQSRELYRKQNFTEDITITEYALQNKDHQIYIKADDEDYQNSTVRFNGKQYSLKQIYAPYHNNTGDAYSKYFANDVAKIAQVFLLNNDELVIILSSSRSNFGMRFYPPFSLSLISIKNGTASMKGTLEGLTFAAQAFTITSQGLELVQLSAETDEAGNEIAQPKRLSAIYQNGKLSSKVMPYTRAYEKQMKPTICKMYLAHTYHESLYDSEDSFAVFLWDNTPDLTELEYTALKTGNTQVWSKLENKYCK